MEKKDHDVIHYDGMTVWSTQGNARPKQGNKKQYKARKGQRKAMQGKAESRKKKNNCQSERNCIVYIYSSIRSNGSNC